MAGPNLPTNVDASYPGSSTDPSVDLHQQHHDLLHRQANRFELDAVPGDGQVLTFDAATNRYWPKNPTGGSAADLSGTPVVVSAASGGSGAYPARPATTRPVVFRGTTQPATDGSTSGGGGMVLGLDEWRYWSGAAVDPSNAVRVDTAQILDANQQARARANVGAASASDVDANAQSITTLQASVSSLAALVAQLQTALAAKADVANSIAAYVPLGGSIPAGLPTNSIVALEVSGAAPTTATDPVFSKYQATSPAAATTLNVAIPTGAQAGQRAVLCLVHSASDGGSPAAARAVGYYKPSGWDMVTDGASTPTPASATISTDRRMELYTKPLSASDISAGVVAVTFSSQQKPTGAIALVDGGGVPIGTVAARTNSSELTKTAPTLTTTLRSLVLTFFGERQTDPATSATAPSGYTQGLGGNTLFASTPGTSPISGGTCLGVASKLADAGSITPGSWTIPAASANAFVATVAVPIQG